MKTFAKLTLALMAAAFISSTPAMAAGEASAIQDAAISAAKEKATEIAKEKATEFVKDKAGSMLNQGKDKATGGDALKQALGGKKGEEVLVNQETVTVETPTGVGQETITTVTPVNPATPGTATPAPATK